jgi:hypothetical protein
MSHNSLIALFLICNLGCGSSNSNSPPAPVAKVTISGADSVFYAGSTQLTATLTDSHGNVLSNRSVTWSSSDLSAVTVTQGGLASYVGPGSSQIAATSEGITGNLLLTSVGLSFVSISLGQLYSCGLTPKGQVYCWGSFGLAVGGSAPALVPSPVPFTVLTVGEPIWVPGVCALSATGVPYCWTPPAAASPVGGGFTFDQISHGGGHACALTAAGIAMCWGYNDLGQLGTGSPPVDQPLPSFVSGALTFSTISAGTNHTCAVAIGGAAYCWGSNANGQLGSAVQPRADDPTAVGGGINFRSITAGTVHSCAAAVDSTTYCWGSGVQGQLGTNNTLSSSTPLPVFGSLRSTSLALGLFHTCALAASGTAYCWGENASGQLGNGSTFPDSVPVQISGGYSFVQISAGQSHTCALTGAGTVFCWGNNQFGQLGVPALAFSTLPVKVTGQP